MNDPHYNPTVPAYVPSSLVNDFNIYDYESEDPFEASARLVQGITPEIFWTRHHGGHWVATGVDAIIGVTSDPALFSSRRVESAQQFESYNPYFPPVDTDPRCTRPIEPPLHRFFCRRAWSRSRREYEN